MKILNIFAMLTLIIGLALAGLAYSLGYGVSAEGPEKLFVVEKGENFAQLASRLERQGIIRSARALRWYWRLVGSKKPLQRGEFLLQSSMAIPSLVYALTEGKAMEHKITVPEGYNLFQIAALLEQKGLCEAEEFLAAAKSEEILRLLPGFVDGQERPQSVEGYIYPDTYLLQKVHTPAEIAAIMLQRFKEIYRIVEEEMRGNPVVERFRFSPHQLLTLASIVEKETGAAEERPLIASVFLNRLQKKMRLQTDPTVIYGVWWEKGSFDGNIRRRDLQSYTPYNTYMISGLPPGPIASPGLSAIRAVLQPSESDFLFFVSRNDGTHIFSKSYGDHQRAVSRTQLDPKAKEGKSWRDLPPEQRANN